MADSVKRHLPPLNALRVFEVAAKSESFSKTAEILCVTQSAVSKQIRLLEEHLGTALFERNGGVVILTAEGEQYMYTVAKSLDILESGSEKFYNQLEKETLTINIMPSLSALWMFSHVEDFQRTHPSIMLHIDSADDLIDWGKNQVDVAIRCLPHAKESSETELLIDETLVLVASPDLLQKQPINQVADILGFQCIELNNRPRLWEEFCAKHQLNYSQMSNGFGCQHFYMVLQAVMENIGLGLVPDFLCRNLLEERKLLNPLGISLKSKYGYYLITPPHKKDQKKVISFSEWIKSRLT